MKGITFYYTVDNELEPIPFANVFESGAAGAYVDGNWIGQSDENGYIEIPEDLTSSYITVSFQQQRDTLPYMSVITGSDIATSIVSNVLDEVVINPDYPTTDEMIDDSKTFFLILLGGIVAYKIYSS